MHAKETKLLPHTPGATTNLQDEKLKSLAKYQQWKSSINPKPPTLSQEHHSLVFVFQPSQSGCATSSLAPFKCFSILWWSFLFWYTNSLNLCHMWCVEFFLDRTQNTEPYEEPLKNSNKKMQTIFIVHWHLLTDSTVHFHHLYASIAQSYKPTLKQRAFLC